MAATLQGAEAPTLDIDISYDQSYDQLKARADDVDLGPYHVKVANLDDLIAMKQTTGRDKDILKLAELIELRKVIRGEQG